ncbi:TPA: glycosyltransferase family 2 protein [Proteus mirabilis]|uniref:glycosyltransferase family 2 protein n=2 Tax=Proteus mirabilis TaxID=584 RepID=UPI0013D6A371|nr:glycosyltransferase family 2 protein [Proteus mirabilis]EKU0059850.1 glycosyltransferase family 2 protein [Proteus mirabilis]EKW9421977.1 glycosyltransferase family 2 protein [Proteus mirabilis]MBL1389296.1 glycosyltransferase family 2 protein [Proteus mirabilis]MBL1396251.1 glycosyltransferase family 2 protein [Proteus mirabilis]MBS3842968.1 glycosyltransferase family 2 protein [Proteus mirabilis]
MMNKKSLPLVSVIIPAYNAKKYLERAVNSVLNQSYKNVEIIIVNDGSSDDTLSIIKKLSVLHKEIIFFSHENQGISKTRNKGIELAKGKYICFLDSDDTYEPDFLMMLLKETEENNIDFSYCLFNKVFDNNDIRPSKEYIDNNTIINFLNFDYFDICCLFLKKQFIEKHQIKFDTNMIVGEDVWFILQSLYLGKYTCVNEYLYNYYHIPTSIMNKKWKVNNYLDEINAWETILENTKLHYTLTQKDELLNKINIKLLNLKVQFMWKLLSSGYFEYLDDYLNKFRYDDHLFSKIKKSRKYKFRLKIIESKSHFLWKITKFFIAKKKNIIEL